MASDDSAGRKPSAEDVFARGGGGKTESVTPLRGERECKELGPPLGAPRKTVVAPSTLALTIQKIKKAKRKGYFGPVHLSRIGQDSG